MIRKLFLLVLLTLSSINLNAQINSVALVGESAGGWPGQTGNPGPIDVHQMTSTDGENWTLDAVTLTTSTTTVSEGVKFRANNNWIINWGAPSFPNGIGISYGPNIQSLAGTYKVTFNSLTGAYSFTPPIIITTPPNPQSPPTQTLCAKTTQPYNVNVGDATHDGSTYAWSISPATPSAVITGNGTNAVTIDWTNVPYGTYTLQTVETNAAGCVSTPVNATINLTQPTAPAFTQVSPVCSGGILASLPTTSNNGITGTWLPAINNTATTTYTFTPTAGLCATTAAMTIVVNQNVTPTFTQVAPICSGGILASLPTTSNNGITGTWLPAINPNITTTYTFTPTAGQCASTTTQTIIITAPVVTSAISFVAPAPVAALPSVTIGTQVWTNKNLDVTTYRDGTPIPQVTNPTAWAALTTGAWCYYNNDPANGAVYGKLYNWYAVAGIYDNASLNNPLLRKKIAPEGWHVPDETEWTTLVVFLSGNNNAFNNAGGQLKEVGNSHWEYPNIGATNSTYFTALPAGICNGGFSGIGQRAVFWSSTGINSYNIGTWPFNHTIMFNDPSLFAGGLNLLTGSSIRCLKD
jgi:uncharacterized protein (TIGR02145 family)